jgi:phosphonate transport system substrate-binding protein
MIALLKLCLLLLVWPSVLHAAEPLRFASLVLENKEALIREFSPLLGWLEQGGNRRMRLVLYEDYDVLLDAFAKRQIDLAYLGPLPYARLRQRHPKAEPLIRFKEANGSASYRCVLAAFRGDAVRLSGLNNKAIGLTQPLSTCGPLSVNAILRKHTGFGLDQTHPLTLGNHEKVALAIVAGEVAVGGLKESIADKYVGLGLEVLASTDPLPGFALIVNRATLDDAQVAQLRWYLLATPPAVYRHWGTSIRHGMQIAVDADYDGVRTLDAKSRPARAGPP